MCGASRLTIFRAMKDLCIPMRPRSKIPKQLQRHPARKTRIISIAALDEDDQ
jgi:hypothetical protein